ncbi:NAD(P)H-dependent oxidoreductase subunit E [Crenobacter caeni]|uniref:NADH-quinone oxidoreductase subunit E n=1 Tax=Crenobacter caeni TaxID=2705474 RepID=A0A6B2KRC7_9NEIS|nr:NAD(P)H-dependent oxidoreductase subunit E [Crenobacter caeni]NDV12690.1 NADH-quinone oxidoreductase subunit E [Crenobacter caeni]
MTDTLTEDALAALIEQHRGRRGALLPLLHAVQATCGYIPDAAIAPIASALRISRAELEGVISFYADFRRSAPNAHRLRICRAESCRAMGSEALWQAAQSAPSDTDIEVVYCLGACAASPAAEYDGRLLCRLDAARIARLWQEDQP